MEREGGRGEDESKGEEGRRERPEGRNKERRPAGCHHFDVIV
jgi:hypothetical protein